MESVASTPRSATLYPDFLDPVRASMLEESRRFVVGAVFDGTHRFDELLTADWSMLDATLARFYGVDGVTGTAFQRVTLPASRRGGVLAQGSVMVRYAHSDQSSPILRGAWVRRTLLCQDFPPPPPNAGGVPDVDPSATTRQRFAQHTSNAACRTCHQYIDNIGFGFERFDAVGRPRATENGMAIDAQGDLNDSEGFGTNTHVTFDTPAALGAALARSERAQTCFVRQYWRFSRGAQETAQDLCAVRQIAQRFRAASSDVRELMVAVVTSPDFLRRR